MSVMMDALNGEYRVEEKRGFIRKKGVGLTFVTGVLVVAAVALAAGGSIAKAFVPSSTPAQVLRIVACPVDLGLY